MMYRFLIIFLLSSCCLYAAEYETAPVKLQIEEYFSFFLEAKSIEVTAQGQQLKAQTIEKSTIYLGNFIEPIQLKERLLNQNTEEFFSSTHITETSIKVVSNCSPYKLNVTLLPDGANDYFILELQQKGSSKKSMSFMTQKTDKTLYVNHLNLMNEWQNFDEAGFATLYDSEDKIVSDEFKVYFSLLNMDQDSKPGQYGGQIIWTLSPTL